MARRRRIGHAIGAAAGGFAEGLSNLAAMHMRQDFNTESAMRNDAIQRQRTANEKVASGEWSPEQAESFVRGRGAEPSVEQKLEEIFTDIGKAPTMQTTPTQDELVGRMKAKRVPLTAFGAAPKTAVPLSGNGDSGDEFPLPSTPLGPVQSRPAQSVFDARQAKLRAFPDENIGEEMQGTGADLQSVNVRGKFNPDSGVTERTTVVPNGPTAGQKGTFEGTTAATSEDLQRPGKIKTAVDTADALRPGQIKTAAGEAAARQRAETNEAIRRAQLSGGLLPEQATAAAQMADDYYTQSKDFFTIEDQFRKLPRLAALAEQPGSLGAADLGIMYTVMKVTDPGAAVQEGDKANVRGTGSLADRIASRYNAVLSGQFLTPQERKDFINMAREHYAAAKSSQDARVQHFAQMAAQRRIPTDLVVRNPSPGMELLGKQVRMNGQVRTVIDVDANGDPILSDVTPTPKKGGR